MIYNKIDSLIKDGFCMHAGDKVTNYVSLSICNIDHYYTEPCADPEVGRGYGRLWKITSDYRFPGMDIRWRANGGPLCLLS